MKLKKSLLLLLSPLFLIGCSNFPNISKEETPKPKIDTVYVTKEIPVKINPLDTLNGPNAYSKAKEFFERGQNFYEEGKDDSSKVYFQKGMRLLSQSALSLEDYNFIDPLENLYNLEQYKSQKEALENEIEVSKEEIANAEKKFPMGERFAEKIAYYKKLYETRQNKWFMNSLEKFLQYKPFIDSVSNEKAIPNLIKYMYPVESGMETYIKSRAGAKGIAQFMTQTAKLWGLKVMGIWYDERMDPLKAIPASMDYINFLYSDLGDPSLAIAAYNCGEGRVIDKLKRFNSFNFDELLKKRVLPRETLEHLPKIYAYQEKSEGINFENPKKDTILDNLLTKNFDTLNVHQQASFGILAKILGISKKDLKKYNPAYGLDATPPEKMVKGEYSFEIRVPKGTKENLVKEFSKLKEKYVFEGGTYTIRKGDNLGKIARKFGVSLYQLKKANGFPIIIYAGHRLIIPGN